MFGPRRMPHLLFELGMDRPKEIALLAIHRLTKPLKGIVPVFKFPMQFPLMFLELAPQVLHRIRQMVGEVVQVGL